MTRKERERAEAERKRRWKQASAIRSRWTDDDHAAEQEDLDRQIAERLESGDVTTFPAMWAKGSSERSYFTE
jgi:hypothetical protein